MDNEIPDLPDVPMMPSAVEYPLQDVIDFFLSGLPPSESAVLIHDGEELDPMNIALRIVPEVATLSDLLGGLREAIQDVLGGGVDIIEVSEAIMNADGPLVYEHCKSRGCVWTDIYTVEDRGEPDVEDRMCPDCDSKIHYHRFNGPDEMGVFMRMDKSETN